MRCAYPKEHCRENEWHLCIPCKGRYRDSIEEGKRCIREERERRLTDPYRKLWVSLVEQVHHSATGFDGLSHPQKLYFAVRLLEGDVYNGGFDQYFFNDSGSYYAYAEEGLIVLGALQTLELLQEAKEILFPGVLVPVETGERRRALPSYGGRFAKAQVDRKTGRPRQALLVRFGGHRSAFGSLRTESWTRSEWAVTLAVRSLHSEPGL